MHLFHLISCHFVLSGYKKEERGKWCSIYQLQDERATHEFLTERNRQEKEVKVTVIQVLVLFLSSIFFPFEQRVTSTAKTKKHGSNIDSRMDSFRHSFFGQTPAWNLISQEDLRGYVLSLVLCLALYIHDTKKYYEKKVLRRHFLLVFLETTFLLFLQNPSLLLS